MLKSIVKPRYADGICLEKKKKLKEMRRKTKIFYHFLKMTKLKKLMIMKKHSVVVHKWCSGCWIRENSNA